mgnify:CR=1 FL=1
MPKDGCPICRMEDMLEKQYVKFITGDAMMEPNIRIETNKKGFCHRHFSQMFTVGQKLPNALILESHLQEIIDKYMPAKLKGKPDKKQLEGIKEELSSCYVCDKGGISSKLLPDFYAETAALTKNYLVSLKADITHFCSMFDYRSQGQDWGTSKDSIERSIAFLTGTD